VIQSSLTSSSSASSTPASASTPPKASLKSYYQLVVDAKGETSVLKRDYKDVQEHAATADQSPHTLCHTNRHHIYRLAG
jgi:hypothetical protein